MPTLPLPSLAPLGGESPQYFNHTGRMLVSNTPRDWTLDQYRDQTVQVARGCYGVFDMADIQQRHFGRTYAEILTNIAAGQFCLLQPVLYRWVRSPKRGVRPLVCIQWGEYRHMPKSDARQAAHTAMRFLPGT